jgi:prepilin-type N-terminal cleavage/methylation domain-containing protein
MAAIINVSGMPLIYCRLFYLVAKNFEVKLKQRSKIMRNKKAFTLIEMLVAVLIIGILAAIALPQYQLVVAKVKAQELLFLTKEAARAQLEYELIHGELANNWASLDFTFPNAEILEGPPPQISNGKVIGSIDTYSGNGVDVLNVNFYFINNGRVPGIYYMLNTNRGLSCVANNEIRYKICEALGGRLDPVYQDRETKIYYF